MLESCICTYQFFVHAFEGSRGLTFEKMLLGKQNKLLTEFSQGIKANTNNTDALSNSERK